VYSVFSLHCSYPDLSSTHQHLHTLDLAFIMDIHYAQFNEEIYHEIYSNNLEIICQVQIAICATTRIEQVTVQLIWSTSMIVIDMNTIA
jgi:hypothetical protein